MKSAITFRWSAFLVCLALVFALATLPAVGAAQAPRIQQAPARPITSVAGADLYTAYCAVCHGRSGDGKGPAAAAFKTPPTDLTLLARQSGGKYPKLKVLRMIGGEDREVPAAHGSPDMPIWGDVFAKLHSSDPALRISNLVGYLETLQVK